MDNFEYKYQETLNGGYNNRLSYVIDSGADDGNPLNTADIKAGMASGNYEYDKLGQLTKDAVEGISGIEWRYGDKKVKKITRNDESSSEVEFIYSPFGQRILKIEKPRSSGNIRPQEDWVYTYYSYDANGQVMGVYNVTMSSTDNRAYLSEQHVYGASRLGMIRQEKLMYNNGYPFPTVIQTVFEHTEGQTYYELSNYLGNVEAVITDRKTWESQSSEEVYDDRFAVPGDLLGWGFGDPVYVGNPPAVDYSITAAGGQLSVYAGSVTGHLGPALKQHFFENGVNYELSFDITTSTPVYVIAGNTGGNVLTDAVFSSGSYSFSFTGNGQTLWYGFACGANQSMQLDNIRLEKTGEYAYEAVLVKTADYYPFGMLMPDRHKDYVPNDYRFAYNGMEVDNEVKGNGNSYTTEFRQYDPRLGRWLSLDPLKGKYPWMSPYVAFNNNPVFFIDPLGLEGDPPKDNGTYNGGDVSDDGCWEYHCDSELSGLDGWVSTETGDYSNYGQNLLRNALGTLNQLDNLGRKMEKLDSQIKRDNWELQEMIDDFPVGGSASPAQFENYTKTIYAEYSESKALAWALPLLPTAMAADGPLPIGDIIGGAILTSAIMYSMIVGEETVSIPIELTLLREIPREPNQFHYITYTKTNPTTGQVYVGRTSGYGTPASIVSARDVNHHMTVAGYGTAVLSTSLPATIPGGYLSRHADASYHAIRGSEQLQIEAWRKLGLSGNKINGISPTNKELGKYLEAARKLLGH